MEGASDNRSVEPASCPSCGSTPLGDRLLRHELEQLRGRRPDGSWEAQICQRCEAVCSIVDRDEGWTLGSPPSGPVRVLRGAPEAPRTDPMIVIERLVAEVRALPTTHPTARVDPADDPIFGGEEAVAPEREAGAVLVTHGRALPDAWAFGR
jgi:hypothetical protein